MAITVTTLLPAASCPAPVAPSQNPTQAACTSAATTAPVSLAFYSGLNGGFCSLNINQIQTSLYYLSTYGGLGAFGVICNPTPGLTLSATGTGLLVTVAAGSAIIGGYVEVASTTVTVADASTNYVWLKQDGTLAVNTSTTPPTATSLFLGQVTAAGGNVTAIDVSGVVLLYPGLAQRTTLDRGAPKDTPPVATRILTKTVSGTYLWDGTTHKAAGSPVYAATLTANFTMDAYDAPTLVLAASGADRTVLLPATPSFGQSTTIVNPGPSSGATNHNILVKDSTGATLISTITPGAAATIPLVANPSTGAAKYSTIAISPALP